MNSMYNRRSSCLQFTCKVKASFFQILNNKAMFRQIHEQISKREESLGKNLKSTCEHRELSSEIQDWLREARYRLETLDTTGSRGSSESVAALNAECSFGGDQIAALEDLEDDIAAVEPFRQARQDIAIQHSDLKSQIIQVTMKVRTFLPLDMHFVTLPLLSSSH